jgi:hypothetical protein
MSDRTEQSTGTACCETEGLGATCCGGSIAGKGSDFAKLRRNLIACLDGWLAEVSKSSASPAGQAPKSSCC